ncbi:hypothetical protein [Mesorhizobium sp.]|uniref:hypothetical protein n=1 Tax=Mesorhizobium sp. TaxID=1871066 RepID=UPI000FE643FA|nr:hypothetical protein [Mesorhizobium sp.]RWO08247.1 MAG: hypothetical protein EOS15_29995 [Mesorhizobium sp.]
MRHDPGYYKPDIGGKHWDSVARRYVEHDTLPQETFGVLSPRTGDNDNDRGPYVVAYTGRFYPFDPKPEDVRIADIAHGLAHSARYNGAGRRFYSTAEHSHHIAIWLLPRYGAQTALTGLLHDAPEPLSGFGDVLRPVKDSAPIIKETETNIWRKALAPAFDLPLDMPLAVHEADSRIIADEMRQNLAEVDPGYRDPLGVTLNFWSPEVAEVWFLSTFKILVEAVKAENMRAA